MMSNKILASVIIPTFNGAEYIEEVLHAVFSQKVDFFFEVVVIDSGSTDGTCEVIKKFPVKLIQISNKEFNHGETRNLGAEKSQGEYLVYITQDATPAHDYWLKEIVDSFSVDDNIANVLGKQIPRPNCSPMIRKNIEETFKLVGDGKDEPTLYFIKQSKEGKEEYEKNRDVMRFNSDVNAAYRRNIWEKVKFRKISYCEDQLIGQDLLENGYKRYYNPKASVFHSHSYAVRDFLKRYFDEYRGYNLAFGYVDKITIPRIIPASVLGWRNDMRYIFSQKEYSLKKKISWSTHALALNFFRNLGAYLGVRHKNMPVCFKRFLSLEHKIKKSK